MPNPGTELHEWAASERRALHQLHADYLKALAGTVVWLSAPVALVMVIAGMGGA